MSRMPRNKDKMLTIFGCLIVAILGAMTGNIPVLRIDADGWHWWPSSEVQP